MEARTLQSAADCALYDAWVKAHPRGTLWQSLEWKTFQEALGRGTRMYVLMEERHIIASALVTIDRTALGLSTWDIARGPLWDVGRRTEDVGRLMTFIMNDAKNNGALSLYFSPPLPFPHPTSSVPRPSLRHEQPSATRLIDLTCSEENILRQMKPKGRYNITVAEKHGISVRESKDISAFMRLLKKTGQRDKFTVHTERYYAAFLKEIPESYLLLAHKPDGEPVAGLLGLRWGSTAYYYYGASAYEHRALMAPYAVQWAAMRRCKAAGVQTYDLLGIAPPNAPPDHPWQGVSAFKEKFGGAVVTYPPEQEMILRPFARRLLQIKRKFLG